MWHSFCVTDIVSETLWKSLDFITSVQLWSFSTGLKASSFNYQMSCYPERKRFLSFLLFFVLSPVRRGQMLNVRGEKVSEALFLRALKNAVAQWPGAQLVDYSCAESGILGKICRVYPWVSNLTFYTPGMLNLLFLYRRFNRRLRSPLPSVYRAKRGEKSNRRTEI